MEIYVVSQCKLELKQSFEQELVHIYNFRDVVFFPFTNLGYLRYSIFWEMSRFMGIYAIIFNV